MRLQRNLGVVTCLVVVALVVGRCLPAAASPDGDIAAALVTVESYRHFLDDMLYAHDGNNRDAPEGPHHALALANIVSLMTSYGLTVTVETFDLYGHTAYNAIGTKLGVLYPDEEYIVGAHYDSKSNPGADDNASGVALMLEAARILTYYPSDRTIRFIAFDAEEDGLSGSKEYANKHITDDILGMISADMVAYNDGTNSVDIFGRGSSAPHRTAVAEAVTTYGRGITPVIGSGVSGSDHFWFEELGFQACLFIENCPGNPYYHLQGDSVDTPNYIDYEFAANNTRAVVGFLVDHAGVHMGAHNADYDEDGDVDLGDYAEFERCFGGPGIPPAPDCEFFDFLSDRDVDSDDWAIFAATWTGPPTEPAVFWPCGTVPAEATTAGSRCISP